MDDKNKQKRSGEGRLPAMAPLANPYVPFQLENPVMYEPTEGLVRGTLFPGLDLPFMGMVNKVPNTKTTLMQLQTMAFGLQELALYLDTHKNDSEALELYQAYQKMYQDCMMKYADKYYPLNHGTPTKGPYEWLNDPWPWEYCANKEV